MEYLGQIRSRLQSGGPASPGLQQPQHSEVANLTLQDFSSRGLVFRVRSRLLGEDIYLVSRDHCRSACDGEGVVYTTDELTVLCSLAPRHIKRVHLLKKLCDGEIISAVAQKEPDALRA